MKTYTVWDEDTKIVLFSREYEEQPPNSSADRVTEDWAQTRRNIELGIYECAVTEAEQAAYMAEKKLRLEYLEGWADNTELSELATITYLNTRYPDAPPFFKVYATAIAMKYEKTESGQWEAYKQEVILLNRTPQNSITKK